ncbi:SAM-dependent methyltransferase [Glutamicibacter uratoxydans]|uniref:SAM-dependent methyltransferase n=1 Tax=Glutamicibacter uratoxydans TaxID=43667 RepID=A0A4Y4DHW9_GLUUR|nr:class I SAM-dependent methyltransferase [Glutamicibacter uratoxydans]GED04822.1 SAM-dependent methyltransferase [Glutamicibacter uratoxydans]
MNGPTENKWLAAVRENPQHSQKFAQRWHALQADGVDIYGEARMADAMVERRSRILDAGCGSGRIGGWLARQGHAVVGVDIDAHLIDVARDDYPEAQWVVGSLADFELPSADSTEQKEFDLVISAGNVLTFLSLSERVPSLARLRDVLAPQGRLVVGFGAERDYDFEQFRLDARSVGLAIDNEYSTWQMNAPSEEFLVAVLSRG